MSIRSNVDAREFDQRIRFDRPERTRAPNGELITEWVELATVWASVDGAKGASEPATAGGIRSVSDYTMWIRADVFERLQLTLLDRVFWKGEPYNIADMPNQQLRGRLIALIVRTGENDG